MISSDSVFTTRPESRSFERGVNLTSQHHAWTWFLGRYRVDDDILGAPVRPAEHQAITGHLGSCSVAIEASSPPAFTTRPLDWDADGNPYGHQVVVECGVWACTCERYARDLTKPALIVSSVEVVADLLGEISDGNPHR